MVKRQQQTQRKRKFWTCLKSKSAGFKHQGLTRLRRGIGAELLPKLALTFCVLPMLPIETVVVTAAFCCQPHFLQRPLQIHNDLTAIGESECDHSAHTLVVDVVVGVIIQTVARGLQGLQQGFGVVGEFEIGHAFKLALW